MDIREKKQIVILIATVLIVFFVSASLYFLLKHNPTCFDRILNQGEVEADCGGPCNPCAEKPVLRDLEVMSVEWAYDIDNKYDIAIKVKNPNSLYGTSSFQYRAVITGESGQELLETSYETGFILPGEEKYLIMPGVVLGGAPAEVKADITQPTWERFTNYEEPNLVVNNKNYQVFVGGVAGFSRANGTLINDSQFDFEKILVKVVLRDGTGKLLAINQQSMNTVRAREHRDFNMVFPHSFPGSVQNVEVEPEVNVYDSANYLLIQGSPEMFQED